MVILRVDERGTDRPTHRRINGLRVGRGECLEGWEGRREGRGESGGVEFLCSHETTAQCCDSSFSVRVAQLVVSVLISSSTSHAGLDSYQS